MNDLKLIREMGPSRKARVARIRRIYGKSVRRPARDLSTDLLDQVDRCTSEAARRLILGVSHKKAVAA